MNSLNFDRKDDNDSILFSRLSEAVSFSEKAQSAKFIGFLDERETYVSSKFLEKSKIQNYRFFGGFDGSKRNVLCIYPEGFICDDNTFPINAVKFSFRKEDELTHRDFLGSLMAANFKRDAIGDILIFDDYAIVFMLETICSPVLSEIKKIGRVGIKSEIFDNVSISYEQKFEEIGGTVASLRIDCVVAMLIKKNREFAADLIKDKKVQINFSDVVKTSAVVIEKDIITIRGFGKYLLNEVGNETKKGRIYITIFRYI